MQRILGRVARWLGMYGIVRSIKARLDGLRPSSIRRRKAMVAFYSQFVRSGEVVFDVGANNGNRVEVFLEIGAKVVAVEPQPFCQDVLLRLFGHDRRFVLVPKALGEAEGTAGMYLSDVSVLSTMSPDWIERTRKSGRFSGNDWTQTISVAVTTLDKLIAEHGEPGFVKIDVEGFELHVLRGLSRPVRALSLELVSENANTMLRCIDALEGLARYEFNYAEGETMRLKSGSWFPAERASDLVREGLEPMFFGDLYARRV